MTPFGLALRREWELALPSVAIRAMAPLIRHGKTFSLSSEGLLRPLWGFCPPITGRLGSLERPLNVAAAPQRGASPHSRRRARTEGGAKTIESKTEQFYAFLSPDNGGTEGGAKTIGTIFEMGRGLSEST